MVSESVKPERERGWVGLGSRFLETGGGGFEGFIRRAG